MALQGPIPVEFAHVFPHGAFAAGAFEPMRDFDASSGDRFVQAKDKATGQPVWVVEVIDADPTARDKTVKIKVVARCPAHAAHSPGWDAFRPGGVRWDDRDAVRQPGGAAGPLPQGGWVRVPGRSGRAAPDGRETAA